MSDKDIIYNVEAERSTIGVILTYPDSINEVKDLEYFHFYNSSHKTIFQAMRSLHKDGMCCDFMGVKNYLSNRGKLEEIGGVKTLYEVIDVDVKNAKTSPKYHAPIIIECYRLREINQAAAVLHEVTSKGGLSKNAIESVVQKILLLNNELQHKETLEFVKTEDAANDLIDYLYTDDPKPPCIPTGFPTLDHALGGGSESDEKVIGGLPKRTVLLGRSGVGKTTVQVALVSKIAHNYYKETGKKTVFFSFEVEKIPLASKFVACRGDINATKILYRNLNSEESNRFAEGVNYFSELGLYLCTPRKASMLDIKNKLTEDKYKDEIGLVVIDYAGLLSSPYDSYKPASKDLQSIKENLDILKDINDDLDISVVLACQAVRTTGDKAKVPPAVHEIALSTDFERYAELILGIHVDEFNSNILQVGVLKNRWGEKRDYDICFEFNPGNNQLIDGSESRLINERQNVISNAVETDDF